MKKTFYITTLFVCSLLFSACNGSSNSCLKERRVEVGATIFRTTYNEITEVFESTKHAEQLTVFGVGNDSILYNKQLVSQLKLPLNAASESTSFVVARDSTAVDTIVIIHENNEQFISLECGCFVFHTLKNVGFISSVIDSVVIVNSAVSNVPENHLNIYYR